MPGRVADLPLRDGLGRMRCSRSSSAFSASLIAQASRSMNCAAAWSVLRCTDWTSSSSQTVASAVNGAGSVVTMTLGIRGSFRDLAVRWWTVCPPRSGGAGRRPGRAGGASPDAVGGTSETTATFEHAVPCRRHARHGTLSCTSAQRALGHEHEHCSLSLSRLLALSRALLLLDLGASLRLRRSDAQRPVEAEPFVGCRSGDPGCCYRCCIRLGTLPNIRSASARSLCSAISAFAARSRPEEDNGYWNREVVQRRQGLRVHHT
jgi:hypothetical protein